MTDTPDSPDQLAAETKLLRDKLNTHLKLCEAQRVYTTMEVRDGRLHIAKIAQKQEEQVLYQAQKAENGQDDE